MFDLTGKYRGSSPERPAGSAGLLRGALHQQGATVAISGDAGAMRLDQLAAELKGSCPRAGPAISPTRTRSRRWWPKAEELMGKLDIPRGQCRDYQGQPPGPAARRGLGPGGRRQSDRNVPLGASGRAGDDAAPLSGRIIGITSVVGVTGNPGQGNYTPRPRPG